MFGFHGMQPFGGTGTGAPPSILLTGMANTTNNKTPRRATLMISSSYLFSFRAMLCRQDYSTAMKIT
jgi:hypothetical protein